MWSGTCFFTQFTGTIRGPVTRNRSRRAVSSSMRGPVKSDDTAGPVSRQREAGGPEGDECSSPTNRRSEAAAAGRDHRTSTYGWTTVQMRSCQLVVATEHTWAAAVTAGRVTSDRIVPPVLGNTLLQAFNTTPPLPTASPRRAGPERRGYGLMAARPMSWSCSDQRRTVQLVFAAAAGSRSWSVWPR